MSLNKNVTVPEGSCINRFSGFPWPPERLRATRVPAPPTQWGAAKRLDSTRFPDNTTNRLRVVTIQLGPCSSSKAGTGSGNPLRISS